MYGKRGYSKRPRRATAARPARKRTKYVKKTARVSTALKTYVSRAIGKNIENKRDWNSGANINIPNVVGAQPYFQSLNWTTPIQISGQYSNAGTRIGNQITCKRAVLTGSLNMKPYDVTNNPNLKDQLVSVVVFKLRQYANGINPTQTTYFSKMFQQGYTASGILNTPLDHIAPFNTDIAMIKAVRRFKMGFSAQNTFTQGAQQSNNDFAYHKYFKIDLTKFYKKVQKFNDFTNDAQNDNLFFMILTAPADNSAYVAPTAPLLLEWFWDATYEDA